MQVLEPQFRQPFQNVNRWFMTLIHQPQFEAVIDKNFNLCEKMAQFDGRLWPWEIFNVYFLANVNGYITFAICHRRSVCLSSAPYSGGWTFRQFFSPYDSPGTLLFWCQKLLMGDAPFPWNLRSKWPTPFQTAKFRPISAHSASTVIASEKSLISTYRKSTTRFPTSHR